MGVVIDEVIGEVRSEPMPEESRTEATGTRTPRQDVAADLRRLAVRAARVHAD
jgi:serine/threonine-protein kinase RIO1